MRILSSWNIKKNFKWTMDSTYEPVWINTDAIFCACNPRKWSKLETMSILQKHIEFAIDNLAHIVVGENDVESENEVEDGE
jgi:hypothetical protein